MFKLTPYFLKFFLFQIISLKTYYERYSNKFNFYLLKFTDNNCKRKYSLNSEILVDYELSILYSKQLNSRVHIGEFPIIDRKKLKKKLIKSDYYKKIKFNRSLKTSGTSGSALIVPITLNFLRYKFASIYFFKNIHNSGIKVKSANFFGRVLFPISKKYPPFWLYSFFTNQLLFSQYHISKHTILNYINALRKYKIKTIHGYPSTLSIFAQEVLENELVEYLQSLNIKSVTVGSENLHRYQKRLIESVFGCKVYIFYGQTESVVDIFECENASLHINESFSFVELIDNKDGYHKLVGTQLANKKFPLIRYDTGDLVVYDETKKCNCGRTSRVIDRIVGRDEDFLILKGGNKIGRLDHIFKDSTNIIEAQFIQSAKGSAQLKIVKNNLFNARDERLILENVKEKLGDNFSITIDYVNEIEKTKSGKLKQVINLINGN